MVNELEENKGLQCREDPVHNHGAGKKEDHKAYVWAYCTTPFADLKAAIYDFAPSRAGEHARTFLGDWRGKLVCDDYAGYKAGFGNGITEIGCMAHARRKFYDLHEANKSELAAKALEYIGGLYEIERETKDLPPDMRREIRQTKAKPLADGPASTDAAHRQG
ncbi:IS66 family transposase, partial [Pseudomonas aeruginosa]